MAELNHPKPFSSPFLKSFWYGGQVGGGIGMPYSPITPVGFNTAAQLCGL